MRRSFVIIALVLAADGPADAQWVVHDAAVTDRNAVTATVKELLVRLQQDVHDQLRKMAARLSALTDLSKYAPLDPPEWHAAAPKGLPASQTYALALHAGDAAEDAYNGAVMPLGDLGEGLDGLTPSAVQALTSALATIEIADAASISGIHDLGQLRAIGRADEQNAIDALAASVIDGSTAQSATASLEKAAGGSIIGARQRQARIRLLTHVVEQLLIDSKRARDSESSALNMQLATWRSAESANRALVHGAGDALATWRQP